ncbi:2-succinyl-5-enolpyruvyl-6-hydroxy-3-cyclohexene-1-carboxylic-acid synthase [Oleiharenicola lentus]|uniref:2-succinyl-5-enolpyruvyl-6-hydroxy-3- cyclohexene-1-carboxylic-acid synthase n=1 Tax=Oleiharenicola lentus TaxID=2508720 RepID=UPI003F664A49
MSRSKEIPLDYRNTNSLWGSVLVETLYRLGVRHAVISPGSRSTPLTMAFARHAGFESIPVLDERSAGFFALGLARRRGEPVVLLCTSGTAGANYFPAVIEAQESAVPLIVITADRPPEMRECRSGQTIDQQKIFGAHVNFYHECAVPVASVSMLRYLRQTVAHACERAQWPYAGPVHLNAPFRDPLPPIEDGTAGVLRGTFDEQRFFSGLSATQLTSTSADRITLRGRGVIVAGQYRPENAERYARCVGKLSAKLGWPVLADTLSPLRNHAKLVPNLVTAYDVIARSEGLMKTLQPEHVLCLNDWPLSKALRHWVQSSDVEVTFVRPHVHNPDALHARTRLVRGSVETVASTIAAQKKDSAWLAAWALAEKKATRTLRNALTRTDWLFEGKASALLPNLLPASTTVFVANSMPVRDFDYFWPANDRGHEVHCNRGANGIDGTLSTALGLAHAADKPAVMVTGDLALLHDANGFLSVPKFKGSLTIVLINNHGGGIFGHLPVAKFDPPFEEFFATPQQVDFAKLCSAHGVKHQVVKDWAQFSTLLKKLPARGVRVLELRTDRQRDATYRGELFASAVKAAERA